MKKLTVLMAGMLLASPAMAQSSQKAASDVPVQSEQPQICEMMHSGLNMRGKMVKGEDGKMTCRMMDHSQMDHGARGHGRNDDAATPAGQTGYTGHESHGPD